MTTDPDQICTQFTNREVNRLLARAEAAEKSLEEAELLLRQSQRYIPSVQLRPDIERWLAKGRVMAETVGERIVRRAYKSDKELASVGEIGFKGLDVEINLAIREAEQAARAKALERRL